jgi:hypothetical protein
MAHRQRQNKTEQTLDGLESRTKRIEQFLESIFGQKDEIQNVQFLLTEMRQVVMFNQRLANENRVLSEFISDKKLQEEFANWQTEKRKTQMEQMKKGQEAAREQSKATEDLQAKADEIEESIERIEKAEAEEAEKKD